VDGDQIGGVWFGSGAVLTRECIGHGPHGTLEGLAWSRGARDEV
jgi:hypothetical protein